MKNPDGNEEKEPLKYENENIEETKILLEKKRENQEENKTVKIKRKCTTKVKEEVIEPKTLSNNKNKIECNFCNKTVLKSSLKKHLNLCNKNPSNQVKDKICEKNKNK